MACFLAPAVSGIVVKTISHGMKKQEEVRANDVNILSNCLLIGSGISMIEHAINGELMLQFPFFTNITSMADVPAMLYEIVFEGGLMTLGITSIWAIWTVVKSVKYNKEQNKVEGGKLSWVKNQVK